MIAEGYKETEIGVIPVEWEVVKLGQICNTTTGKLNANAMVENGKYKFFTCAKEPYLIDEYKFDTEALLISGNGANVGYIHYYNGKFNAYQRTYVLDNFTNNIQLVKYLLQRLLKDRIDKEKNTGNTPYITLDTITDMIIPLPPLKEQEKIADILSTADDKIDAIASQIEKAQILKKGLLQKLLSEGIGHSEFKDSELGKIPESWEVVELGSVSDILDPHPSHRAPKEEADGYPFVGIGDITENGIINLSSARKVSLDDVLQQNKNIQINKDDIGFGRVASVGKIIKFNTYDFPFALSPTMAVIKAKNIENSFLYQFLSSDLTKKQFNGLTSGSTRIALGIQNLRKLFISLPPLKEQKQIAKILSTADEKLEVLRAKKKKYETLKKGLLQKLLSGEVRV